MRWVALGAAALALVLGLVVGHGAPRCGGQPMRPGQWCSVALLGRSTTISYRQKAALLDDVSHTYLVLAGVLGAAGTAAVVVRSRRRWARAALVARAEDGLARELRAAAERRDLGPVVASGVGLDRQLVHLCERGVAVDRNGQVTVLPWADLVAVYEALGDVGVARCRLVTADAALDLRAAPGDHVVAAVAEAADAALGRTALPALVEAVEDGRWLVFGPLGVDATALYRAGRRPTAVPWSRVEAVAPRVRVVPGAVTSRLAVTYRGGRRAGRRRRFSVDLLAVPNPRLLVDLAATLRAGGPLRPAPS